jgi:hypothetical protein
MRNILTKWLAFSDFGPFAANYKWELSNLLFLWKPSFLGYENTGNLIRFLKTILEFLTFNNPVIAQDIFLISAFLLGVSGMYTLLTKKINLNQISASLASFLFVFNPVSIAEYSNGGYPIFLIYALIPWFLYLFDSLLQNYQFKKAIIFSLIVAIYLVNLQVAFWIFLAMSIYFLFYISIRKNIPIKNSGLIILHALLGIFANLISFFTFLQYSKNFESISYLGTFRFTYAQEFISNLFRLVGNQGTPQLVLGYFTVNIEYIAGFTFAIITTIGFLYWKSLKLEKIELYFFSASIFLSTIAFISLIRLGFFNEFILNKNAFLVSARNPQKLLYMFSFSYCLLFAIGIEQIRKHVRNSIFVLVILSVMISYAAQNSFLINGDFGLSSFRGESFYIDSTKHGILTDITNQIPDGANILYLPMDYGVSQKVEDFPNIITYKLGGDQVSDSQIGNLVGQIYKQICNGEPAAEVNLKLKINYVILEKNASTQGAYGSEDCKIFNSYGTPYIWGSFQYFDNLFKGEKILYEDDKFKVINLGQDVIPAISTFVSDTYVVSSSTADSLAIEFALSKNIQIITSESKAKPSGVGLMELIFNNPTDLERLQSQGYLRRTIAAGPTTSIYISSAQSNNLEINGVPFLANADTNFHSKELLGTKNHLVEFRDSDLKYKNLIPNGSFELGPWQEKVMDCDNYDSNPILSQEIIERDNGNALQLEAVRHTACTSIDLSIPKVTGATYLQFKFDYQGQNSKFASYFISFNDPEKTTTHESLPISDNDWHSYTKNIEIPGGTSNLSLYVYSNPSNNNTSSINRYDNFSLIELPNLQNAFYLRTESDSVQTLTNPKSTESDPINPTKKLVHIKGATTPFFLSMSESYHDKWYLELNNAKVQGRLGGWWPFAAPDKVPDEYHYQLNGFLNAWYVDTTQLCEVQKLAGCTQNPDGSYDIEMVIEFWPQRWFYLGLIISGATLAGCLGYLGYAGVGHVRRKYRLRIRK